MTAFWFSVYLKTCSKKLSLQSWKNVTFTLEWKNEICPFPPWGKMTINLENKDLRKFNSCVLVNVSFSHFRILLRDKDLSLSNNLSIFFHDKVKKLFLSNIESHYLPRMLQMATLILFIEGSSNEQRQSSTSFAQRYFSGFIACGDPKGYYFYS